MRRPAPLGLQRSGRPLPGTAGRLVLSTVFPNDLNPLGGYDLCCAGNDSRALYYAWESILGYDKGKGELRLNLLLNRTSPWADINSYLPYTGRVEVRIKHRSTLKVRLNGWIDLKGVTAAVDGKNRAIRGRGGMPISVPARAGEVFTLEFPIAERMEKIEEFDLEYTVTFRGADVVDINPPGTNTPLHQRAHYRSRSRLT